MNEETLVEFNKELTALLEKYNVELAIEDIPASKKVVVSPKKVIETEEVKLDK